MHRSGLLRRVAPRNDWVLCASLGWGVRDEPTRYPFQVSDYPEQLHQRLENDHHNRSGQVVRQGQGDGQERPRQPMYNRGSASVCAYRGRLDTLGALSEYAEDLTAMRGRSGRIITTCVVIR